MIAARLPTFRPPYRPGCLHAVAPLAAVLPLLALLVCVGATPALARKGDARAGLFIGTTTSSVSGYTTFGTAFGGSYGYEFQDDLEWTFGGTFASTEGNTTVTDASGANPHEVTLTAKTAAVRTGLVAYFGRSLEGAVVPYVGGGLSFLNYDLTYPETSVGTTSGTGPGAYVQAGVELRLTRAVTLIPQLGLQVHTIKTESGDRTGLVSGGLVFTIRIST